MRALWIPLFLALAGCVGSPTDVPLNTVSVSADLSALSQWIADQEAQVTDIVPGAEKHLVLHAPHKTPYAIVYLHGFSASRQEISPVCERVAAELGANLFFTRLRGHGRTSVEAMGAVSAEDWMTDAAEALAIGQRIGEQVIVVSTSTGGGLAAWLAHQNPPNVAAWVYLSPNFGLHDPNSRMLRWPGRRMLMRAVVGEYREWEPRSALQAKYWTNKYPATALFPMADLTSHVIDLDLSGATQPTLVFYSPQDQIINPSMVESRFQDMGGQPKRLIPITDSDDLMNHVLAGDAVSPNKTDFVVDEILGFLKTNLTIQ